MWGLTARTKKICGPALLLFFSGLAASVNLYAGQVSIEPTRTYFLRYGGEGLRTSSPGELISAYNELNEVRFNDCTRFQATDPTTCVKYTASSPQPGSSGDPLKDTYNGEPAWFTVSATLYTTNNVGFFWGGLCSLGLSKPGAYRFKGVALDQTVPEGAST